MFGRRNIYQGQGCIQATTDQRARSSNTIRVNSNLNVDKVESVQSGVGLVIGVIPSGGIMRHSNNLKSNLHNASSSGSALDMKNINNTKELNFREINTSPFLGKVITINSFIN